MSGNKITLEYLKYEKYILWLGKIESSQVYWPTPTNHYAPHEPYSAFPFSQKCVLLLFFFS